MTLGLKESGFALLERHSVKVNVTVLTSGLINLRAGCLVSVIVLAPLLFYCQKLCIKKKEEAPPNSEKNSFKSALSISVSKLELSSLYCSM